MDLGLAGKSVIVTGGASNIGRAITLGFAREGANITVAELDAEQAEKVASALSELPQVAKAELKEGELTLFPTNGEGLLEAVTAAIGENQWQVSALRLEAGRLDEVFHSITEGST